MKLIYLIFLLIFFQKRIIVKNLIKRIRKLEDISYINNLKFKFEKLKNNNPNKAVKLIEKWMVKAKNNIHKGKFKLKKLKKLIKNKKKNVLSNLEYKKDELLNNYINLKLNKIKIIKKIIKKNRNLLKFTKKNCYFNIKKFIFSKDCENLNNCYKKNVLYYNCKKRNNFKLDDFDDENKDDNEDDSEDNNEDSNENIKEKNYNNKFKKIEQNHNHYILKNFKEYKNKDDLSNNTKEDYFKKHFLINKKNDNENREFNPNLFINKDKSSFKKISLDDENNNENKKFILLKQFIDKFKINKYKFLKYLVNN